MNKSKARVININEAFKDKLNKLQRQKESGKLRSNELNRILSLVNKIKWKRDLTKDDLRDLHEIESIQKGDLNKIYPEESFFMPAFPKSLDGRLYWYQNFEKNPIRELDEKEKDLWHRFSTHGFQGYIRRDGSIRAYLLSGRYDQGD